MVEQGGSVKKHGFGFVLLKQLERIWRLFGTGLSFFLFGLGGLVIGIAVFPLVFVFVRNPDTRQRVARKLVSNAFKLHLAVMNGLGVLSYEIKGVENAIQGENQIIIANHPTLIDVVFLLSLFPMADCVIKEAITRNPFMRSVALSANWIPSGNIGQLLKTCVARLKAGASLLLFPEGTRSEPGQSMGFKLGAASFAVKAGADVLPVTIQCTQPKFLVKYQPWYRVPPDRPFISIQIYPSRSLDTLIDPGLHPYRATRELNAAFLEFFESKLN